MSTIKITGTFNGSANNFIKIDLYRPNPDIYDFSKNYSQSFTEILTDLHPGESYFLDLTGYSAGGTFTIKVTGDVVDDIDESYSESFKPGLVVVIA